MADLLEAAKNALDVLDEARTYTSSESWSPSMTEECERAMRMLRAALSVQGEPVAHVGNSDFEGWFSTYSPAGKGDKQRARDAYAAGMSDPGAAPAAPAVPQWKPIETAPDGVMLLFADMQASEARHWVFCGWRYSGLRGNSVQMPDNTARSATHWRYLPAAPSAPGAEVKP